MALIYCEICGALIKGQGQPSPEGVICDGCFHSRRVVPDGGEGAEAEVLQFNCCYCQSLLRLKTVDRRTRVRCPQCGDTFYLHADGRIESKFQGNQTAVLQQDQVALPNLSQTMGTPKPAATNDKTQPLRRPDGIQQQMLDELKPKRLEFADALPQKQITPSSMVDTDQYRSQRSLDLLPEGVGPGQAEAAGAFIERSDMLPEPGEESDSDSGEVDEEGSDRGTRGKRGPGKKRPKPPKKQREPKERLSPEEEKQQRKEREAAEKERAKRFAEAERRGQELAAVGGRRILTGLLAWGLFLLPLGGSVGATLGSTSRGSGFATRGGLGRGLERLGEQVERGVRTLNGVLPEGTRAQLPDKQ